MKYDVGPCDSVVERFYFDVSTKQCLPFEYGGCEVSQSIKNKTTLSPNILIILIGV